MLCGVGKLVEHEHEVLVPGLARDERERVLPRRERSRAERQAKVLVHLTREVGKVERVVLHLCGERKRGLALREAHGERRLADATATVEDDHLESALGIQGLELVKLVLASDEHACLPSTAIVCMITIILLVIIQTMRLAFYREIEASGAEVHRSQAWDLRSRQVHLEVESGRFQTICRSSLVATRTLANGERWRGKCLT